MLGLSSETTRGDMVRAVMEGIAYEVAANLPIAAELGTPVTEIRAGGGPNKSEVWNQIYADVCGVPVVTTVTDGDAAIGCAWMSAIADGAVDLETCASKYAATKRAYEPDARQHERYREVGAALDALYPALRTYYAVAARLDCG
jgi:sugar (pentulose or hexulose) kinase